MLDVKAKTKLHITYYILPGLLFPASPRGCGRHTPNKLLLALIAPMWPTISRLCCVVVSLYAVATSNPQSYICLRGATIGQTSKTTVLPILQGIPAFRDFTIHDPRYFVIPF